MKLRGIKLAAVALTAACVLVSAGCTTRSQMAFTVNGAVTTTDEVQVMIDGCTAALGMATSPISASGLVGTMIGVDLARQVAADQKVTYTDDELRQPIQSGSVASLMLTDPNCAQLAFGMVLAGLLADQLGASIFQADAQAIPVIVNPRFGTWDTATLSISGSGSLSQADS